MKYSETSNGVVYYVKGKGLVLCFEHGATHLPVIMGEDLSKKELENSQFYPLDVGLNTTSYCEDLVYDICDSLV